MSDDFLTKARHDWDEVNLSALKRVIVQAYAATADLTDPAKNPLFDTPNQPMLAGTNRWGLMDRFLEGACKDGTFHGIEAVWLPLSKKGTGGIHALELRGKHTCVIPFHLSDPEDVPRDSNLREEKRLFNHHNPMLQGFEEAPDADTSGLINLILVHGDKTAEFAFLRAYHDPEQKGAYISVTDNLMVSTPAVLVPKVDAEEVAEPEIQLQPALRPARQGTAGN